MLSKAMVRSGFKPGDRVRVRVGKPLVGRFGTVLSGSDIPGRLRIDLDAFRGDGPFYLFPDALVKTTSQEIADGIRGVR
jgi:hypothetical protein